MTNTAYYIAENEALRKLVEDAKTTWHHTGKVDADRIHRAAELVETGAVTVGDDEVVTVTSNGTAYRMSQHTCKDTEHGAIDGRCKHRWAKTLYRALQAQTGKPRRIAYHLDYGYHREVEYEAPGLYRWFPHENHPGYLVAAAALEVGPLVN